MSKYTVIIAGGDCQTFMKCYEAESVREAQKLAVEACADAWDEEVEGLFIAAVIAGDHPDISEPKDYYVGGE